MMGLDASVAWSLPWHELFRILGGVISTLRAYTALYFHLVFDLRRCFPSASRGFGQNRQVVAEYRAADG